MRASKASAFRANLSRYWISCATANVDYGIAYQNLLNAANEKLTRPLKDGYRMEGHLDSAKFEKLFLSSDGIVIALRASGNPRILYGL